MIENHPFLARVHRLRWLIGGVIVMVAVGVGVLIVQAPNASTVTETPCITATDTAACLRFPTVSGTSLQGVAFTLPADFDSALNFIVMPFTEAQQIRAAEWLPLARELAAQHDDFAYYDVPVLPAMNPLVRVAVVSGMTVIIEEDLRAVSIMLFLEDIDRFLAALAIPHRDAMQVLLLNASGEVLWQASGEYTDALGAELRALVSRQ